ncbi:hypothetical protein DY000_02014674 [Brassica cretica]|uniref:Uncharacterized protein n=1 Tax=Brassica cretica TaxID=69181 RepID=A0ABQ7CN59_BRACR|nr:hypothetical protein DY000_02014674 [Brassica cretica]
MRPESAAETNQEGIKPIRPGASYLGNHPLCRLGESQPMKWAMRVRVALHIAPARIPSGACRGTADMSDLTRL